MNKALLITKMRPRKSSLRNGGELDTKQLLAALMAFKRGDFSARLPAAWTGVAGKIADTFNDVIRTNQRMTQELGRIVRVVGKEGRITQRAALSDGAESWSDALGGSNVSVEDLVSDNNGSEWTFGEENHCGCPRRISRIEGHHQQNGGSTPFLRLGSDTRGARSWHGRHAWGPGQSRRSFGDVERLDGLGQLDGFESHVTSP